MRTSYDIEKLDTFLQNFYTVTGIKISVFDDEFNNITEYPRPINEFCALIRKTECGMDGCRECDNAAFREATRRRGIYIYTCHAGMTEAVAPIIFNDTIIGFVILAHMLPKETLESSVENAIALSTRYGVATDDAKTAISLMTPISYEKIEAAARLLDAITTYFRVTNLVSLRNEDLAFRISRYIDENLTSKLDTDTLCRIFFISRTKLHQLSVSSFGVSIAKYILNKRVDKAKKLLSDGFSVERCAEHVGFSTANYFSKVFRRECGMSPGEFAKKAK
jgi:AraC-like DNA-binding protein